MKLAAALIALTLVSTTALAETKYPEVKIGTEEDTYAISGPKDFEFVLGKKQRFLITSQNPSFQYQFKTDLWAESDIDQIVINHLEIHKVPAPGWIEFDEKGTVRVDFTPKKAGTYKWFINTLEAKGMTGTITVK